MTLFPIYTTALYQMPRSYMKGFVGSAGMFNFNWSGQHIQFNYINTSIFIDILVTNRFYAASSNVYSLDYVFNWAASETYISGVPVGGNMWVGFHPMLTEPTWRIQILSSVAVDETLKLDLPPMPAGYWRPQP